MGREVRMVPADWKHPEKDPNEGHPRGNKYRALFPPEDVAALRAAWDEEEAQWLRGFVRSYDSAGWREKCEAARGCWSFSEWSGARPDLGDYMPNWPERTHLQMYENTTEGTPISPVMPDAESLARWLADNNASAFGYDPAPYEWWLACIRAREVRS